MWKFVLMLVCVLHIAVIRGSTSSEECGIIENVKRTRVVNGTVSSEGQWPWMAYVKRINFFGSDKFIFNCGGSLIGKRHILTSAGCVVDRKYKPVAPGLFNVTLGTHNLQNDGEQYRVAQVIIHPDYDVSTFDNVCEKFIENINNIAVLILDRDVIRSKYVIPICLPNNYLREKTFNGRKAYVAGWGHTENYGVNSDVLRWATLTVWRNDDCHEVYEKTLIRIHEDDICAGGTLNAGRNICSGDEGGPLMIFD